MLEQCRIPIGAGVIDFWQITPIVLRQVASWNVNLKGGHFVTVEEHAFLQFFLDEGLQHLPHHVEQKRLFHVVYLKRVTINLIANFKQLHN